jgi:hypothetical protein
MAKCKAKATLPSGVVIRAQSGSNGREVCDIRNQTHILHEVRVRNLLLFTLKVTVGGVILSTNPKVEFRSANGNTTVSRRGWYKTQDIRGYEEEIIIEAHIVSANPISPGEETIRTHLDVYWYQDQETDKTYVEFDVKSY